jgi:hypothetical protein
MDGNISNVDIVHMQVIITHSFAIGTHFVVVTNFIKIEVMQLATIQVKA